MTPMRGWSRAISASSFPAIPTIVARNMPGGGGVIASNHVYNVAPQDGTTLTIITSSFANEQLFGNPQISYDARQLPRHRSAARHHLGAVLLAHVADQDAQRHADQAGHHGDLVGQRDPGLSAHRDEPLPRHPVQGDPRLSRRRATTCMAVERGETDGGIEHLYRPVAAVLRLSARRRSSTSWCSSRSARPPTCRTCRPCSSSPRMRTATRCSAISSPTTRSAVRCSRRPTCRRRGLRCCGRRSRRCSPTPDFQAEAAQLKLPLAPQDRRGDAEGRRRHLRHLARRDGQGQGSEQVVARSSDAGIVAGRRRAG